MINFLKIYQSFSQKYRVNLKSFSNNQTHQATQKTRGGAKVVKSYDEQGRLLSVVKNDELVESSFGYEGLTLNLSRIPKSPINKEMLTFKKKLRFCYYDPDIGRFISQDPRPYWATWWGESLSVCSEPCWVG